MTTDRFVQVEVGLPRSRLVDRLRDDLGITRVEAVGHLVLLWSAALTLRTRGQIGDRSDRWIEEEAGWTGQREQGAFARAIREHHLDEHGVIRDFDEKYGKLDVDREKAADLKRRQRAKSKDTDVTVEVVSDVRSTGTSSALSTGQTDDSPVIPSISLSVSQSVDLKENQDQKPVGRENGEHHRALREVEERFGEFAQWPVGLVRAAGNPAATAATILSHLDGMHGPVYAPEVIALAAREYAASDEPTFKPRLFAGFVRRAEGTVKLTESRKQQQNETRHIRGEVQRDDRVGDEIAADNNLIAEFKLRHHVEYEALLAEVERIIPPKWKGALRGPMVRAELARRIRLLDDEQGGTRAAV